MEAIPGITTAGPRPVEAEAGARGAVARRGEEHSSRSDVAATPENMERVKMAVETLDVVLARQPETRFHFQVHNDSGKIQVQLVNFRTGEVVEEIPSKKLLDFTSQLEQLTGIALEKHA